VNLRADNRFKPAFR